MDQPPLSADKHVPRAAAEIFKNFLRLIFLIIFLRLMAS